MAKKSFYPTTLSVSGKNVAGSNPVGTPATPGVLTPPNVPKKPGVLHGLGPVTKEFGHPSVKGAHGWGHVAKLGHMRLSGHKGAHRVGSPFRPMNILKPK